MLSKRVRPFIQTDIERFMEDLKKEVKHAGLVFEPDMDALVVEDILGRIRGLLVRDKPNNSCVLVVNNLEEDVAEALIQVHNKLILEERKNEDI